MSANNNWSSGWLTCVWVLLLVTLSCPSLAGVYKWVDAKGKTHYGDAPPLTGKANELKLRDNSVHSQAQLSGGATPQKAAAKSSTKVVIYTASWCGYCKRAKSLLTARGVNYTEYDVETSSQGKRDYERMNGSGIPITMIGNVRINGFEEGTFNTVLSNAGF